MSADDRAGPVLRGVPALALLLAAGLVLRLVLAFVVAPGEGLAADLTLFTKWALTMAQSGPGTFYQQAGTDSYPPVWLFLLWPIGIVGKGLAAISGAPATDVVRVLVKLPPVVADVLVALTVAREVRARAGERAGLVAAALFLFVPLTWYDSAIWGQMDAIGTGILLAALLFLVRGWSEAATVAAVLAILTKPQYAIVLAVLGPVLLRRHLLRIGSGPVPSFSRGSRLAALDDGFRGLLTRRQGPERLASSALAGLATAALLLAPFDIWRLASGTVTGLPLVDHLRGYVALVSGLADARNVLTANAFNLWALVGPTPLFHELSRTFLWTYDTLAVAGGVPAVAIGSGLLVLAAIVVAAVLLVRDDRTAILLGFTVVALAFFALPTRVHERYQYPALVTAVLFAATSVRWRWWFVLVGVLGAVNLHAVATLARDGFGTPGMVGWPVGDLARSDPVVILVSLGNTALFLALLGAWVRTVGTPAARTVRQSGLAALVGRPGQAPPPPAAMEPVRGPGGDEAAAGPESSLALEPGAPAARLSGARPVAVITAGPAGWWAALQVATATLAARMPPPAPPGLPDETEGTDSGRLPAGRGRRLDRRDLLAIVALVLVTFTMRAYRLDTPRTMYFDELYYPSTATEFLRAWKYGIPSNIFEWTHPHVSKYIMAASLMALGDDRVVARASVGAPVTDVALQPVVAGGSATAPAGDRIAIATGDGIRVARHGDLSAWLQVTAPGAQAVAFDAQADRLYAGTASGRILAVPGAALDEAARAGAPVVAATPIGTMDAPVRRLWVVGRDRLLAESDRGILRLVDGQTGEVLRTTTVRDIGGLVAIPSTGGTRVIAAVPDGLLEINPTNLSLIGVTPLAGKALGLAFVDGSPAGWGNKDTLPNPALYVALDGNRMAQVAVGNDGKLTSADVFPMPGPVTEVRWDAPSNMVHVLGRTPSGQPTIYVVEPHTDSVFADATLPFQPSAWVLDVEPSTPDLDRQHALAFSAGGDVAIVDIGGHAFAWRLPGVVLGALTAGLMYGLARLLFRRRSIATLLGIFIALDGLLFSQGRIGMNDSILGFFIVAAVTLLVALIRGPTAGRWARVGLLAGLPLVGVLLGLAFATKWVGAYAMGGAILVVLSRTPPGRRLLLLGLIGLTGVLGFQALAGQPANLAFPAIMLALVAVAAVVVAREWPARWSWRGDRASAEVDGTVPGTAPGPGWLDPRHRYGLPFAWALACLALLPVVVYVASYVPWAFWASGSPQLFPGWPAGHTGQTFLDLQAQMYAYHNNLRTPHGMSSPWWAWPFGLRPIWGYYDTFSDGSQALILLTGNPVLLWLSVPAVAYGAWQAWRRRSASLAVVVTMMLSLWLPWARIDRVTYNYHWYTALPFAYLLLAHFLADVWDGISRRTVLLARIAFAATLMAPALLWIFRGGLCAMAGVSQRNPAAFECTRSGSDLVFPIGLWLAGSLIAAWLIRRTRDPRRLVAAIVAVAAVAFVVLLPGISAWRLPSGWPLIFQGLLPTWDGSFTFGSNTAPSVATPLLSVGAVAVTLLGVAVAWVAGRRGRGLALLPALPAGLGGLDVAGRVRSLGAGTARPEGSGQELATGAGRPSGATEEGAAPSFDAAAAPGGPAGAGGTPPDEAAQEPPAPATPPNPATRPRSPELPAHKLPHGGSYRRSARRQGDHRAPMATPVAAARERLESPSRTIASAWIPAGLFVAFVVLYAFVNHGRKAGLDYFVPLADAFLHGRTGLSASFSWMVELIPRNGLFYVPYPPAPAVLLVPFVLVAGPGLEQSTMSIVLGAANVALLAAILGRMGVGVRERIVLGLAFGAGTITWFSAQLGTAWHFEHVVAMFFMFLAILVAQRRGPMFLVGLLYAAAITTRMTLLLALPFFVAYLVDRAIREGSGGRESFGGLRGRGRTARLDGLDRRRLARLGLPMLAGLAIPGLADMGYNLARFGSPFEIGYGLLNSLSDPRFRFGLFNVAYLPNDVAALFLSGADRISGFPWFRPRIDGGPSILLTSPILLWAVRSWRPDWFNLGAWVSVGLIMVPTLIYADAGGDQFGFRTAQEAYPFLILLAARGLRGRLGRGAWMAIGVGVVVNGWAMAWAYLGWFTRQVPDSTIPYLGPAWAPLGIVVALMAVTVLAFRKHAPGGPGRPGPGRPGVGMRDRVAGWGARLPWGGGRSAMVTWPAALVLLVAVGSAAFQLLTAVRIDLRAGCGGDGGQYCLMAAGQLAVEPFSRRILLPDLVRGLGLLGADGFAVVNAVVLAATLVTFVVLCVAGVRAQSGRGSLRSLVIALAALVFLGNRNTLHLYLTYPVLTDFLALLELFIGCLALIATRGDTRWIWVVASAAFAGAITRENVPVILTLSALLVCAIDRRPWRTVVPIAVASAVGLWIAFSQPTASVEHESVIGVVSRWIGLNFGDPDMFFRFVVMILLGLGPLGIAAAAWWRRIRRDDASRVFAVTAIVFIAVSLLSGGDTDRILMPAGLLLAACVLRLVEPQAVGLVPTLLIVAAGWVWQLPFVVIAADATAWFSFWALRVAPLADVVKYGLVPVVVGTPLLAAGLLVQRRGSRWSLGSRLAHD